MSILLKNIDTIVTNDDFGRILHNVDLLIEDGKITKIEKNISEKADETIDCSKKIIMPGLINMHTHAAMSLLRGYNDELPLHDWLDAVWKAEAKLTDKIVYWGTKLAILEMLKTGTIAFQDMYFYQERVVDAAIEMGIRAQVSAGFLDFFDAEKRDRDIKLTKKLYDYVKNKKNPRITFAIGPHAPYTVSEESFKWIAMFAKENNLPVHIHIAETEKEVIEFKKNAHMSPIEALKQWGVLEVPITIAHGIYLSKTDIQILKNTKATIAYNPVSNMKLSSGIMNYPSLKTAKINVALGTDGCASNNNLDMFEEMKVGVLLQKLKYGSQAIDAKQILNMATKNGAKALNIPSGAIKEGANADLIIYAKNIVEMIPTYDIISNIVYSAGSKGVETVIIAGKIVMKDKKIESEEKIKEEANKVAEKILY